MLSALLDSFLRLVPPDNCEILFAIVDNDGDASARRAFQAFSAQKGPRQASYYFVESKQGIPAARNRALDAALDLTADLAVFIDDDEIADENWLAELVSAYRHRHWVLIGGPVRPIPWSGRQQLSPWTKLVLDGVEHEYRKRARRAEWLLKQGRAGEVAIATNNWLIDLKWLCTTALRFDQRQSPSGGSDMRFFSEAKARGARSGWCPSAIVYASTPRSRLSIRYQFRRARGQSNAAFLRKNSSRSGIAATQTLATCVRKAMLAVACLTILPFRPGAAIIGATHAVGWILGRLDALAGRPPRLYASPDGA